MYALLEEIFALVAGADGSSNARVVARTTDALSLNTNRIIAAKSDYESVLCYRESCATVSIPIVRPPLLRFLV